MQNEGQTQLPKGKEGHPCANPTSLEFALKTSFFIDFILFSPAYSKETEMSHFSYKKPEKAWNYHTITYHIPV